MFRNRLAKMHRHLGKQAKRLGITCYRLYDHDLPEFPFCIEVYGQKIYAAEYKRRHGMTDDEHEAWLTQCKGSIAEILETDPGSVFMKLRQRKSGRGGQYKKLDATRNEFVVEENGLKFLVNLDDYLDTGLFLDHRLTREKVKAVAEDKKVLNLFCYTGSFSVYAASGMASEVVSVDLSNTYLNWAGRNMELNGFTDNKKYQYIQADVMQYLQEAQGNYFDLVILDPPTFSNSKRMHDILDVQRDHVFMINDCLRILQKGGVIYFSTNFTKFKMENERIESDSIRDITRQTTPFDFEKRLKRFCFLIEKND